MRCTALPLANRFPVIIYRPFLNTDVPAIAKVWSSQPALRARFSQVTEQVLERHVFAKPYFDRRGLLVAEEEGECIGFAHAGGGPNEANDAVDFQVSALHGVFVQARDDAEAIADRLLLAAEDFLRASGATRVLAGGWFPVIPFYLGFYGGSRLPGIMADDEVQRRRFERHGYIEHGRTCILQVDAQAFRPPVNRQQMTNRRTHQIIASFDPQSDSWWEACTLGWSERVRFSLIDKDTGAAVGQVMFWDMEPLSSSWGRRSMGLYDLNIEDNRRRQGRATYLVGEALRQLGSQGVSLVEVQVARADAATMSLFLKLGFSEVGEGIRMDKNIQA